jgi:surface protein
MQTAISTASDTVVAVSSNAALKTTTSYLSAQISNIVGGAPATLDTIAELGAALNNQNNLAGSLTTMLANKAAAADVSALSTALTQKANQSDYVSLSVVVGAKATATATETASISATVLGNTVNTLVAEVSALKTRGGTTNPDTVAVNGVSLTDLYNWTKELYVKLGLTNADGTINEKLNRLANPTLVSSVLGFEYTAGGAINKVNHVITVQFDKDQKSVTVTGGIGNLTTTVNNLVLNASNQCVFTVPYAGNVAFYEANKTQVSIVALDTQYRLAPLVSSVIVSAPDATDAAYKHAIPTVTNKTISTSMPNIFSVATPSSRYHAETFPYIGAMSSWDMSIYFKVTSDWSWRALVGSMYMNINGSGRNWGVWVSHTNFIAWGWQASDIVTTLAVASNVNYHLKIIKTTTTIQFDLKNMDDGTTNTQTSTHSNPSMGSNEPVTIGGWISSSGESGAVISELNVGSYTNTSNYNTPSTTGINVYSSSNAYIKTVTTPGSGVFTDSVAYEPSKLGSILMKVSAAGESSKRESDLINVSGEDVASHETPVLNGSVVYSGTIANATYTLASNVTKVSVFTKTNDIGPTVTGIATQYGTVGYGVEAYGNYYANWANAAPGVHNAHYRLRFSNGIVSNVSIFSNSDAIGGLTNPDLSFKLTNIPAGGVTAILQGRNNAFTGNVWYDIVNKTIQVTQYTPTIKFGGGGNNQFVNSPAMFPTDTAVVSSATVTTPGTITLAIPYIAAHAGTRSFYVVADADTNRKQSAASALQPFQMPITANGVTIKYVGDAAIVPTSEPLFIQANPRGTVTEWFAVVKQDMKAAISSYASGTDGPFKPPGQSVAVEWKNIVTTLMTDMSGLFNSKSGFNEPIASWDTGNVINMAYLFANTPTNGFNQPIGAWNTSNVTNMDSMFYNSGLFNKAIGSWNTAAVTNMGGMFYNAHAFNQPIGTWNTGAVTNMNYMFYNAIEFNQNISTWNVAAVSPKPPTNFVNTANSVLTAQNSPIWFPIVLDANGTTVKYVGNVPTSDLLFIQANPRATGTEWFAVVKQSMNAAITNYASGTDGPFKPPGQSVAVPFNNIVTTLMTGMNDMFANKTSFNEPIASWDTSNVTTMYQMFANASAFNRPIGAWNTSNVTTMYGMFYSASAYAFNQPIGAWNTGAVTNMNYMFAGANAFNQNISTWNVAAVSPKPPTNFINPSNPALTARNSPVWFPWTFTHSVTYSGFDPTQQLLSDDSSSQSSGWATVSANPYIQTDFGSVRIVNSIIVGPITDAGWNWSYLNGAALEYYNNINGTWNLLSNISQPDDPLLPRVYSTNISTRHVRILMPAQLYAYMAVGTFHFTFA